MPDVTFGKTAPPKEGTGPAIPQDPSPSGRNVRGGPERPPLTVCPYLLSGYGSITIVQVTVLGEGSIEMPS